jgi:ketosteroid isomerase-like protein
VSQENVDVVRRAVKAFSERDADVAVRYLSPEIEWEPASPAVLERAVYRGREQVAEATAALWEVWDVFRFEESEVRDLGDSVLWLGHVHMKGGASRVELDQEFANHLELLDGKIVRARAYLSWEEGLTAAGLRGTEEGR